MRGSVLAGILAVLLLPLAAAFPQDAVFTDSVWIEFGEPEAGQGLAFTNPPETSRAVEVAGRACQAIVHENDQHRLHFRVDPGFNIAGRDTISVVVEYLDNGRADMGIRYTGASGMLPSDPVRRGRSDEWKTARWQLTDPLFGQPDGGGIEFAIHASGWSGTADLHVASVRVTHEAVKLSVEPRIFAGDGASHTPVAVEVYQANGVAAPDGTEVAVSCNDAVVPQTVVTQNGRAELNLTHGTETATLRVTAQYGDASDTALIYQVAGEGELVEFTQALDPAYIRENLVYAGREAESITVVQDVDPNDPDVVEVRLTFPEGLEKNRALLVMDEPPLPGKPNTLRMELGSDGTLFELNVLMGDAGDEAFLYQAFSDRGGLDGEHSAAMDVDRIGYREGGDSLIDLPVNWAMLSLHFVPGTTEGVLYIRKVEADCIGTIASAANATGPVTAYRTEPVIIEGVAPIGSDQGEYCRQISALQSALEAIGCAADYDDLMVASGAAFSIAWRPGAYVYHVCEACPDDVVVAGALATGASAERIECQNADVMWDLLRASIDDGRPALVPYALGARVVYGYDPDERLLYQQANVTPQDRPQTVALSRVFASGRPADPQSVVVLRYDEDGEVPDLDWVGILERAVGYADWPVDEPVEGDLAFGIAAYETWAETIRAGQGESTVKLAVDLTLPFAARIIQKRRSAARLLARDAALSDHFADAAECYHAAADLLEAIGPTWAVGGWTGEELRASFADPAVRASVADLIALAGEQEAAAVDSLRLALAELAP